MTQKTGAAPILVRKRIIRTNVRAPTASTLDVDITPCLQRMQISVRESIPCSQHSMEGRYMPVTHPLSREHSRVPFPASTNMCSDSPFSASAKGSAHAFVLCASFKENSGEKNLMEYRILENVFQFLMG